MCLATGEAAGANLPEVLRSQHSSEMDTLNKSLIY